VPTFTKALYVNRNLLGTKELPRFLEIPFYTDLIVYSKYFGPYLPRPQNLKSVFTGEVSEQ
jgi:hypothetical protein